MSCSASPTVVSPIAWSLRVVAGPIPQMRSTGSGRRNSSSPSGGTTYSPSGFAERLAIFASTFVRATPTLSGSPTSSLTSRRSRSPSSRGSAPSEAGTVMSRNASSSEPGSTISVNRSKIANTSRLASMYESNAVSTTIAPGHRRFARDVAIPPRTP